MVSAIAVSLGFLAVNVMTLSVILKLNQRTGRSCTPVERQAALPAGQRHLSASDILGWEFEYARVTASESMEQRHTMMNFYLLIAGINVTAVVALLGANLRIQAVPDPRTVDVSLEFAATMPATLLLWLLCGIGWHYFLAIIRLRQAWHDSACAMNQIKAFYVAHAADCEPEELASAFRWHSATLPPPDKPWTVFFYSATLIAFLDGVAYVTGGLLLCDLGAPILLPDVALLVLFGLFYFGFHIWLYFAFLQSQPEIVAGWNLPEGV